MRHKRMLIGTLLVLALSACAAPVPPITTAVPTLTPTRAFVPTFTPQAVHTPKPEQPAATASPTALTIQMEPTLTPHPRDDRVSVDDLPIGELGNYVNLAFGYWLQYPVTWYTGFGNRPLLASFSNLDPGTHNRESMRREGCLIEVNASTNIYGIPLSDLLAQLARSFHNAEEFDLDREPAVLVPPANELDPVQSETVFAQYNDWLIVLALDYTMDADHVCRPVWENLLNTWRWVTPEFATYRNTNYGYAISHPRDWYRFNAHERGIFISSEDPIGTRDLVALARKGMLVETDVFENPDELPLKEWLAAQDFDIDLTNDIPLLEGVLGVRVLRQGPSPDVQEMSGYFEGLLGEIHMVTCRYPADQGEFRPIANAIIYSFSF